MKNKIIRGDNITELSRIQRATVNLCYIDPPFNTRKVRKHTRQAMTTVGEFTQGKTKKTRKGFAGKEYEVRDITTMEYDDYYESNAKYIEKLRPVIREIFRVLAPDGSLFFHIDWRQAANCRIMLDSIFGYDNCINEIVWIYDFGGRSRSKWSAKHDTIFWYAKDKNNYKFNFDAMDRIPYMAPGLVTPDKAKLGKTPTDSWWNTIVPTNGKEKTGYPTQKPIAILNRIIKVHSDKNDVVLDCFAGSGTAGEAAAINGRKFILIDNNADAIKVMKRRLSKYKDVVVRK